MLTLLRDTNMHLKRSRFYGLLGPNQWVKPWLTSCIGFGFLFAPSPDVGSTTWHELAGMADPGQGLFTLEDYVRKGGWRAPRGILIAIYGMAATMHHVHAAGGLPGARVCA